MVTLGAGYGAVKIWRDKPRSEQRGSSSATENPPYNDVTGNGLSPDQEGYRQLLPKSFKSLKIEWVDFDGAGTKKVAVLGQDYADIKLAGTGDEIPSYEVFVFTQDTTTKEWNKTYHLKADGEDVTERRTKIIVDQSFGKISLTGRAEAIAYLTMSPSAAGPCMESVHVVYRVHDKFQQASLQEAFPLCLKSFRQESIGTLELAFDAFRVSAGGNLTDPSCCPTGGSTMTMDVSSWMAISRKPVQVTYCAPFRSNENYS